MDQGGSKGIGTPVDSQGGAEIRTVTDPGAGLDSKAGSGAERVSLEPLNLGNWLEPSFSFRLRRRGNDVEKLGTIREKLQQTTPSLGKLQKVCPPFQELQRFGPSPGRLQLNLPPLQQCLGSRKLA
ncbi:hypothetical protein M9458_033985, partial [Cirrhinus mrigala]